MTTKIGKKDCVGWSEKWNAWFACPVCYPHEGRKEYKFYQYGDIKKGDQFCCDCGTEFEWEEGDYGESYSKDDKK